MEDFIKKAQAIELANTSTTVPGFGSGVNKALAATSDKVFAIKESVANIRKLAARVERTENASFEMEKYSGITMTNGGDLEDGTDMGSNWTTINNQSLITFNAGVNVSVGFKITPRLLRQARTNLDAFLDRYRTKIAFDLARREDTYLYSVLADAASSTFYGGDATSKVTITAGDIFTVEMFEKMVDALQENEYEPSDFICPVRIAGQLRRNARFDNNASFSTAITADGKTAVKLGDVLIHVVKGTTIIPQPTDGASSIKITSAVMLDRSSAYGIVDFLKRPGASPVQIYTGQPDPTTPNNNFWRILGQQEIQAKALDANAIVDAQVSLV